MASSSIFKSVCEDILAPCGVKVGGYKDEIFEHLYEDERDEITCQICYLIVKDPMRCTNTHLFCAACIFAWSMTTPENVDRCPACRVKGAYSEDAVVSDRVGNMAIRCLKCNWKGQVSDYRVHAHGFEDIGIDPKAAGLPAVRSSNGDIVFPDIPHDDNFGVSIDGSRQEHQRQHLTMELELAQSQTRLAFLLDIFEEDLARHRRNLDNLVRLQRRYNAEQFNEVMRLEAELGQITGNLLRLIESADNDMNQLTTRIRGNRGSGEGEGRQLQSRYPDGRIPSRRDLTTQQPASLDLHSHGPVEEPQNPIRRARFFQSQYNSNLRQHLQQTPSNNTTNPVETETSSTIQAASASSPAAMTSEFENQSSRLLHQRESSTPNSVSHTNNPTGHTSTATSSTTVVNSHSNNLSSTRQTNQQQTIHPPHSTHRQPVTNPHEIVYPPRPPSQRGPNRLFSTMQTPIRSVITTPATNVTANPFTITYPPPPAGTSNNTAQTSIEHTRRVSRQELRQNAADRLRRSQEGNS